MLLERNYYYSHFTHWERLNSLTTVMVSHKPQRLGLNPTVAECKVHAVITSVLTQAFLFPCLLRCSVSLRTKSATGWHRRGCCCCRSSALSTSSAAIETRQWMLKVQGADVQEAKEPRMAAKLAVITNCTAAVISAAANTASPAFASASAVDALGSKCPRVILWTSSCFYISVAHYLYILCLRTQA